MIERMLILGFEDNCKIYIYVCVCVCIYTYSYNSRDFIRKKCRKAKEVESVSEQILVSFDRKDLFLSVFCL